MGVVLDNRGAQRGSTAPLFNGIARTLKARLDSDFMIAFCSYIIPWLALLYLGNRHDCNVPSLLHYSASFCSPKSIVKKTFVNQIHGGS